jgi:hypothetical protein
MRYLTATYTDNDRVHPAAKYQLVMWDSRFHGGEYEDGCLLGCSAV